MWRGVCRLKIYIAGICTTMIGEQRGEYKEAINSLNQGMNLLESYYYILKGNNNALNWIVPFINSKPCKSFMLDSGAFTLINGKKDGIKNINPYIEGYIDFINKTKTNLFFEMDIDCVLPLKEVEKIRTKIENETGKQTIPVWHASRGSEYFIEMCKNYPYVSIGSPLLRDHNKEKALSTFPWFINTAHKYGAKIHLLGMGSPTILKKYPFDSADSTSWNSGIRYGTILQRFDGVGIQTIKPDSNLKGNRAKIVEYCLKEWIKFANFMEYDYVYR